MASAQTTILVPILQDYNNMVNVANGQLGTAPGIALNTTMLEPLKHFHMMEPFNRTLRTECRGIFLPIGIEHHIVCFRVFRKKAH